MPKTCSSQYMYLTILQKKNFKKMLISLTLISQFFCKTITCVKNKKFRKLILIYLINNLFI